MLHDSQTSGVIQKQKKLESRRRTWVLPFMAEPSEFGVMEGLFVFTMMEYSERFILCVVCSFLFNHHF